MKIALISPVSPIRGGIAQHSTALASELSGRPDLDLTIISFARQYPRWLYPGASDRDPNQVQLRGADTDFILDSMNPLSWRRAVARILSADHGMAVIPAWTFFVAPALGFIAGALRNSGIPVVMIVHNAGDHEGARWKDAVLCYQLRRATRFLVHNESIARTLSQSFPGIQADVCPHPLYDNYPEARGTLAPKAKLELLFFGLVRPYKGLDILLRALALAEIDDVRLTVVGEFWRGRRETESLIGTLGLGDKVELVPRYVSDREAVEYFARCDAVVAPYIEASGSGVVALSQWCQRPVIASDLPGLAEAIRDGSTGWLFPRGDAAALAHLLKSRVSRDTAEKMRPNLAALRKELSWERFADAILKQRPST